MADETPAAEATPAVTPGRETSEFWLTKVIVVGAAILDAIALVLETLHQAGILPDKPWAATALAAVGTVMAVVKATGYTRSRTLQKLAELAPAAAAGVAAAAPFAKAVAEAVAEQLKQHQAQPPTALSPPLPRVATPQPSQPPGPSGLPLQPK